MKKINYLIAAIFFISLSAFAQDIEEVKIKSKFYGANKMKKAPKKIYINSFNVNYEIYKEAIDFKAGGNGGRIGGNTSNATAKAAIGLGGIDANKMQVKTNELYQNFINRLKNEGFEIVAAEEAGKTDVFKNWQKASGPIIQENLTGIINCIPQDYSFYYKRKTTDGEIKKGFLGGIGLQPKLSKALGDAIIADVNLYVMFSEPGSDWMKGKAAKVKIKTNLRLVNNHAISIPQKFKKKKSTLGKLFGSVKIKGATDTYPAISSVQFTQGKIGLGATSQFNGNLKEDVEINNILKKQKIVAYQKQGSFVPTSFTTFSNYLDAKADRFSTTTKWIEVDGDKYAEGFYNACNTFLTKNLDAFFKKIK
ncbi:hypothetical protein JL193_11240 [Polaribacter batillariae]|uniref:Uncharacterized protein n=1 Tax=Polaribacter batillariae TaxID=2808900 RepID=A0ABX7ST39_9FLAO|nr:hypothetical protein [Polaribacter batillariae]QTD36711.1 hypothetical protein JL193_11240 [Polaribacter batillariae]